MAVYGSNTSSQYIDFLEGVEMSNSISDYTPINEMMYVVIEQSEEDFNKIMMECGVRELAYVEENHTEMVYEAGNIKKLTDSVKKWFEDLWAKIKKMINTALDNIAKKSAEFRSKILKNLNKDFLKKRLENVEVTRNFGTTYKYQDIVKNNTKFIESLDNAESELVEIENEINKNVKNGDTNFGDFENKCKNIISKSVESVIHSYTSTDVKNIRSTDFSSSNVKKLLLEYLRGQIINVNGAWVKSNFDEILKEVGEFPKTKRELKSAYTKTKDSINKSIKSIKSHDNSKMFEASVFTKIVKYVKQLKQLLVVCQQSVISCINEREAFYRSVIIKVIGTKPVKESAWDNDYFSESSTNDTISSLFNW